MSVVFGALILLAWNKSVKDQVLHGIIVYLLMESTHINNVLNTDNNNLTIDILFDIILTNQTQHTVKE